jgi:hypothetical protein
VNKPIIQVFSSLIEIASVYVLISIPLQGLQGVGPAGIIIVEDEMNAVVLLHQGAASFQKGQGVEDKAICQGGLLILVDCLE